MARSCVRGKERRRWCSAEFTRHGSTTITDCQHKCSCHSNGMVGSNGEWGKWKDRRGLGGKRGLEKLWKSMAIVGVKRTARKNAHPLHKEKPQRVGHPELARSVRACHPSRERVNFVRTTKLHRGKDRARHKREETKSPSLAKPGKDGPPAGFSYFTNPRVDRRMLIASVLT